MKAKSTFSFTTRRSSTGSSASGDPTSRKPQHIAAAFLKRNIPAIVFANSRLITEILVRYLKEIARTTGHVPRATSLSDIAAAICRMRGGRSSAGCGRAAFAASFPRMRWSWVSISAVWMFQCSPDIPEPSLPRWQRMGRAGRRSGTSVAVLVASSNPLDQFIVNHPEYFLSQPPEMGLINPDNIHILLSHLQCATFELPFGADERFGGHDVSEILEFLRERGFIHRAGNKWHWTNDSYPADSISLRSISSDNFVVVETTGDARIIGEVDYTSAFSTLA